MKILFLMIITSLVMIIAKAFFGLLVDSKTIKKLSKSRYTDRFWNAISYRIHLFPYHPSLALSLDSIAYIFILGLTSISF